MNTSSNCKIPLDYIFVFVEVFYSSMVFVIIVKQIGRSNHIIDDPFSFNEKMIQFFESFFRGVMMINLKFKDLEVLSESSLSCFY